MKERKVMTTITSIEQLEEIYGQPGEASLVKESAIITQEYEKIINASPFVALATSGPEGLDCSPRGDMAGFVRVQDEKTLLLPDRKGNNRIDSLRNIVRDPRVALLFLIPGVGATFRVNGKAALSTDEDLLQSFAVEGKPPRSVIVITVDTVYFQCARAIVRSRLWDAEAQVDPRTLPTPGDILATMSEGRVGGADYDREWPARAEKSMW